MAKIILYSDDEFKGKKLELTNSDSNFATDKFNDTVSSVKVESGTWQIYGDKNFQGPSVTLSPNGGPHGDGKYIAPIFMGGFNDYFSSIELVHS